VKSRHFKRLVQTITYLPHFLSWVIVYGLVFALFSETSGIINITLRQYFGTSIPVLSDPSLFRILLVGSEVWKEAGWGAIIYLAAISGVDPNLYEAAIIDGANRLQLIWHVTLSGIRSTIIIMLLLSLGRILDGGFDQVYIMQNLQVQEVAYIVDLWVYRTGLEQLNFSLASAVGLMKTAVSFSLLLFVNSMARRWGESLW
jgi:putative aldouronate transport system permease protein